MTPKISVIVASHNSNHLLLSALDSIYNQSVAPAEVILVDDSSKIPTEDLLKNYPHQQRRFREFLGGYGAALNFAIQRATGDLISPLDHDDYWPTDKLEWQSKLLMEEGADVVVGGVINQWLLPNSETRDEVMGAARVLGSCLIHRRAFEIVGPFDESAQIHEIIEWWSRARDRLKVVTDNRVALYRRIHGANMTLNPSPRTKSDLIARIRRHVELKQHVESEDEEC